MGSLEATALVFAVSLLIGGFAISIGAKLAFKSKDYSHAVLTALVGAIAWAVVSWVFETLEAPGALASLVALVIWISVIRWRYQVGWIRGSLIGLFAWVAALVVLALLSLLGVSSLDAYGIPGT